MSTPRTILDRVRSRRKNEEAKNSTEDSIVDNTTSEMEDPLPISPSIKISRLKNNEDPDLEVSGSNSSQFVASCLQYWDSDPFVIKNDNGDDVPTGQKLKDLFCVDEPDQESFKFRSDVIQSFEKYDDDLLDKIWIIYNPFNDTALSEDVLMKIVYDWLFLCSSIDDTKSPRMSKNIEPLFAAVFDTFSDNHTSREVFSYVVKCLMDIHSICGAPNGEDMEACETDHLFMMMSADTIHVNSHEIMAVFEKNGIHRDDPRIRSIITNLENYTIDGENALYSNIPLTLEEFSKIVGGNVLFMERAVRNKFIVPNMPQFIETLTEIFEKCRKFTGGEVASYIPELANVDPELYGLSVCTIDGQRVSIGDTTFDYSIQSTSKPISYCIASELYGSDRVHSQVGTEASGLPFNAVTLKRVSESRSIPHNPLLNAGAISICSCIKPKDDLADRYKTLKNYWDRLVAGAGKTGFDNVVFLSERKSASKNRCLFNYMIDQGTFPKSTDLTNTLELYFQQCSITANTDQMAVMASVFATGGVNPITDDRIFKTDIVKNCSCIMYAAGMYDYSGQWGFDVGLPAKSGVSGVVFVVVPGKMGIAIYSPRLDENGNSLRSVEFCRELVKHFNFHLFESYTENKYDPTISHFEKEQNISTTIYAASEGDITELRRMVAMGIDIWLGDYDNRTPLHVAACNGQVSIVNYYIRLARQKFVDKLCSKEEVAELLSPVDRWSDTPLDNAIKMYDEDSFPSGKFSKAICKKNTLSIIKKMRRYGAKSDLLDKGVSLSPSITGVHESDFSSVIPSL